MCCQQELGTPTLSITMSDFVTKNCALETVLVKQASSPIRNSLTSVWEPSEIFYRAFCTRLLQAEEPKVVCLVRRDSSIGGTSAAWTVILHVGTGTLQAG